MYERELTDTENDRIEGLYVLGMDHIRNFSSLKPDQLDRKTILLTIRDIIDDLRSQGSAWSKEKYELLDSLAAVWGRMVSKTSEWRWIHLKYRKLDGIALAPADGGYACFPVEFIRGLVENSSSENTVIQLFGRIEEGRLPPSLQGKGYVILS